MDSDEVGESEDEQMDSAVDEDEKQIAAGAVPLTDCLFCPHHSSSLMKNMAHMTKAHSFFIPDIEYLVDLRGLIKYLGKHDSSSPPPTPTRLNTLFYCNKQI